MRSINFLLTYLLTYLLTNNGPWLDSSSNDNAIRYVLPVLWSTHTQLYFTTDVVAKTDILNKQ